MKILFPIGSLFPSNFGGPAYTIYWLASALRKVQNTSIYLITTDFGLNENANIILNKWSERICGNTVYYKTQVHYFPVKLLVNSLITIPKVDIIHLNGIFYPPSWILAIFGLVFNKKVVWSVRGEFQEKALQYSSFKKRAVLVFIKLFYKKINFHATSIEEYDNISRFLTKSKITVLPNLLPIEKITEIQKENYILFLGRKHPIKALDRLIESISISKNFTEKNFKLIIAGPDEDDNYLNYLKELIAAHNLSKIVMILDKVEGIEKQNLIAKAYALILPSHSENFGNVVIEALANRTPVIASKGTPWEILEIKSAGYWVENDPSTLSIAIDKIITLNQENYNDLCNNAYNLAMNEYDIDTNIYKWVDYYKNL